MQMYKRKTMKGFTLDTLPYVAIMFTLFIVVLSFMASLTEDIQDTQTADGYAYNISEAGLEGMETMGDQSPLIASAIIIAVIIGIILTYFAFGTRKSS